MPHLIFKFGAEARHTSAKYDYDLISCLSDPFPSGPCIDRSRAARGEIAGESYAGYLSTRWRALDRLVLELGVRGDHQEYAALSDNQLSPRVGLLFDLPSDSTLRMGWGHYHQSQQPEELQVQDGIIELARAERAEHRTISLERRLSESLSLRAELFDKHYQDLRPRYENFLDTFEIVPEAEPDRIRVHPNTARVYGAELAFSGEPTDAFDWRLAYSWIRTRDSFDTYTAPRAWDQTHTVVSSLNWIFNNWNLNVFATYHTGWPTTPLYFEVSQGPNGILVDTQVGTRNSERLPSYSRIDLRLTRTNLLSNGEFTYFFEIYNALDQDNPCCVDDVYVYPDNSGALQTYLDYDDWLPLLPSFGFSWTFR
jgi:outer membrane receptor protein involved in Fe transport